MAKYEINKVVYKTSVLIDSGMCEKVTMIYEVGNEDIVFYFGDLYGHQEASLSLEQIISIRDGLNEIINVYEYTGE